MTTIQDCDHTVLESPGGACFAQDRTRLVAAAPLEALGRRVASLADEDHRNVFLYPSCPSSCAPSLSGRTCCYDARPAPPSVPEEN